MTEHADELEHADPEELEQVDVDPESEAFTAPEKITSVVRAVLARPGEPKVRALVAVITSPLGERLLLRPMLALLPPLDQPGEWDEWLAVLAGCALELASDGVNVDVDQARADARFMLAALFAGDEADG